MAGRASKARRYARRCQGGQHVTRPSIAKASHQPMPVDEMPACFARAAPPSMPSGPRGPVLSC